MEYDINRPWLSLDQWQKDYIAAWDKNCFLLKGRQCGGTTAMSIKVVEMCVHHYEKDEVVLINSLTERQAQLMLAKSLAYAKALYPDLIATGKDKPTMHKLFFKNGAGILCYAAGIEGDSTRGYTLKKIMPDEGSRLGEEYFIASVPTLSVSKGTMDIGSTPSGKKHKDGSLKFFYKCSKDPDFKKFYISAEDCPRHDKEFLKKQKVKLSKLAYAQEYLAIFTDELKRLIDDDLIEELCILKRREVKREGDYYGGSDIAGFGQDECTYEIFDEVNEDRIEQVENIIENRNYTTDTSKKIINLDKSYDFIKYGVDDGGMGFGVFSELMDDDEMKRKTIGLNNASRLWARDSSGKEIKEKSKKLLKEEMYMNLLVLMENKKVWFLDDDEVKISLASLQHEDGKIFGSDDHVAEGIIRALWLATKDKGLNPYIG